MMDVEQKREMLQLVRTAIKAILTGAQMVQIGTRSLTRANLSELRKMERELEGEIATFELGEREIPGVRVPFFDRR